MELPGRPDELAAGRDDEPDPRRRHLGWLVAMLCAGVAVAVLRPDVSLLSDGSDERNPSRPGALTPAPRGGPLEVVAWATRGDLAGDAAFVGSAVARMREERPALSRVLFAGRLPGGGRLVLAGSDVVRGVVSTAVHALVVEEGAAVGDSAVAEVAALTDPQQVLAWAARGPGGRVIAVVLSRPGPVRVEISPRVRFGEDGSPTRVWTPQRARDGVVVADLGRTVDPVVAVRATGSGVFPLPEIVRVSSRLTLKVSVALEVAGTERRSYAGPDPDLLVRGLRQAAGSFADLALADLRVLWSGAAVRPGRLALVLVTRPDGVRLQALVGQQDSYGYPLGVRALPRDGPDELPWLLEPSSSRAPTMLLCPTGAGTLVYRRAGQDTRRLTVPASGALFLVAPGPSAPSAGGAEVTLLDPTGRELLTTTLPDPGFADPLALQP